MVLIILRSITLVAAIVWLANGFWNGQALLVTYVYGSVGLFVLVALLLSVFDIPFRVHTERFGIVTLLTRISDFAVVPYPPDQSSRPEFAGLRREKPHHGG